MSGYFRTSYIEDVALLDTRAQKAWFAALIAGSAILMRAATNKPLRSVAGTLDNESSAMVNTMQQVGKATSIISHLRTFGRAAHAEVRPAEAEAGDGIRTASALRRSGTVQMIAALFMICRTLIEIA
mgnify:CR=1 FL=1